MELKKNILITGGKGYLGTRIANFLSEIDYFSVFVTSRNNLPLENKRVQLISVSTSSDNLEIVLESIDVVIHLAALDAKNSDLFPEEAIDVNIKDTIKWLEASAKSKVCHFIYFSTIHVYGNSLIDNISENSPAMPVHPYAITHKCAEDYVLYYGKKHGFKSQIFRLSNSMGYPESEMSQWNLLVPDLCKKAVLTNKIPLHSNPKTTRDFIPIQDVCRAIEHFIKNKEIEEGIYNISSAKSMTILEMATKIKQQCQELGINLPTIDLLSQEINEPPSYTIDNTKLKETGFVLNENYELEIKGLLTYCLNNFKK